MRVSSAWGWVGTDLVFDDGYDASLSRHAVVVATDLFLRKRLSLQIAAGGIVDGELRAGGIARQLGPGWLLGGAFSWRVLDGEDAEPFVLMTASLGFAGTRTRSDPPLVAAPQRGSYLASDARFGVAVGKTFFEAVTPYLAARVFGGPIRWVEDGRERLGSDRYHAHLGAGLGLRLAPVDVFFEGAPLGERGLSAGVGLMLP